MKSSRMWVTAVLALGLSAGLGACTGATPSTTPSHGPATTPAGVATITPAATLPASVAGLFEQTWTQFLASQWPHLAVPKFVYIPIGTTVLSGCTDASGRIAATSRAAAVCQQDSTIYYGEHIVRVLYRLQVALPQLELVTILTAYAQDHRQIPTSPGATQETTLRAERLCIAGAWLQHAITQHVAGASDATVDGYHQALKITGSAPDASWAAIMQAITYGRQHGTVACSARYFPGHPLANVH